MNGRKAPDGPGNDEDSAGQIDVERFMEERITLKQVMGQLRTWELGSRSAMRLMQREKTAE
jgi:hypothetical protein